MERRGMSWRSIPPELGVPTVMAALLDLVGHVLPEDHGSSELSLATGMTRCILLIHGLLVLRRRAAGRASALFVVGAVLQGVAAATALAMSLSSTRLSDAAWVAVVEPLSYVVSASVVGFAIAMVTAARAWGSPIAAIALLASFAWRMPAIPGTLVYASLPSPLHGKLFYLLAMLATQVALLGVYARLDRPVAPSDPIAAERGARRVTLALRLRAAAVVASAVMPILLRLSGARAWVLVFLGVFGVATIVVVVGQISGLLAMASARLASLSPAGLYVAGFTALWDVLLNTLLLVFERGRITPLLAVLPVVAGAIGMVVAGWAVHGVAGPRGARALRAAIANRVAWIIALEIVNALVVGLVHSHPRQVLGLGLVSLAAQVSVLLLCGGLFARVADQIQVNAAADVF